MKRGGYESNIDDIRYLLSVASQVDLQKVAGLIGATFELVGATPRFLDSNGFELSVAEVQRRTQVNPDVQRTIYNLWMTYAH